MFEKYFKKPTHLPKSPIKHLLHPDTFNPNSFLMALLTVGLTIIIGIWLAMLIKNIRLKKDYSNEMINPIKHQTTDSMYQTINRNIL